MHLKQDTEAALRVVFAIGARAEAGTAIRGLKRSELILQTGLPAVRVNRICACLEREGILLARRARGNEPVYYPGAAFWSRSLLDVMRAAEDDMQLLALFDRSSALFRTQGDLLDGVQTEMEQLLGRITLKRLLRRVGAKGMSGRW